jgi:hypothetical protein
VERDPSISVEQWFNDIMPVGSRSYTRRSVGGQEAIVTADGTVIVKSPDGRKSVHFAASGIDKEGMKSVQAGLNRILDTFSFTHKGEGRPDRPQSQNPKEPDPTVNLQQPTAIQPASSPYEATDKNMLHFALNSCWRKSVYVECFFTVTNKSSKEIRLFFVSTGLTNQTSDESQTSVIVDELGKKSLASYLGLGSLAHNAVISGTRSGNFLLTREAALTGELAFAHCDQQTTGVLPVIRITYGVNNPYVNSEWNSVDFKNVPFEIETTK